MAADVSLELLDRVRIASPCPAKWEDMTGDERVRHCAACNLNVYNLSAMSREDAAALLASHLTPTGAKSGERLCGTWLRRADGTVIFGDCPVGFAKVRARTRRAAARLAAAVGLTALLSGMLARAERSGWDPREYAAFETVARWIGVPGPILKQMRTAGAMVILPVLPSVTQTSPDVAVDQSEAR
jgi:hypothetical protein